MATSSLQDNKEGVTRAEIEGLRGSLSSCLPSTDLAVKELARTWSSFLAPAPTGAKVINERTSPKSRKNVREGGLGKKSFDDTLSVETDSSFYDNVAPCFEEFEKETKNDLFEDIRTSIDTRDTLEENKDRREKPHALADSSVVYRLPPTAGTRNVTSAPAMNGFLTWPFAYSGRNRAPYPLPTRKINHKLGAAQRLGFIGDDLASMGESNSSSFNSSSEPDLHGMKTGAHSDDDFSDASMDLHDSKRGNECTTLALSLTLTSAHDSFSQVLDDSAYASDEDSKGYEYGSGEWDVVSVLDLQSLYNDETGSVNSRALQDFLDAAGNASFDSISDSGDRSASDDSVGRVEEAIAKFKLHASLLGVDEKDLLLAIQQGAIE